MQLLIEKSSKDVFICKKDSSTKAHIMLVIFLVFFAGVHFWHDVKAKLLDRISLGIQLEDCIRPCNLSFFIYFFAADHFRRNAKA